MNKEITENVKSYYLKNNGLKSKQYGHNGPYYDPQTPVRVVAHEIFIFAYLYKYSQNDYFLDLMKANAEYLMSEDALPMGKVFYCRKTPYKDLSNGVIGQAWAIEGLVKAYEIFKEDKYLIKAVEVFKNHPFDFDKGVWYTLNVDGSIRGIDGTFNHQLWFAAVGFQILSVKEDTEIKETCDRFMNRVSKLHAVYRNGLIKHPLRSRGIRALVSKALRIYKLFRNSLLKKTFKYKENGYHLFNLYGFALIKKYGGHFSFFDSKMFQQELTYALSQDLVKGLEESKIEKDIHIMKNIKYPNVNIYGFPYNSPAFELPFIVDQFLKPTKENKELIDYYWLKQMDITYDANEKGFFKNTEDPITLNARFYEYIRS